MRLAPVMLALLLALSPGAVAMQVSAPTAAAAQTTVGSTDVAVGTDTTSAMDTARPTVNGNTTAILTLGTQPDRVEFDSPSVSLGDSLKTDNGEFRSELSVKTLDQKLDSAGSNEAKKRILNQYRYQIENRIITLETKERRAAGAFSNGSIGANQYARTLGQIDAEADEIRRQARVMQQQARTVPNFGMPDIERTLNGKLLTLEGPVRDRISKSFQGAASPARIHVSTADTGLVLSTVVGDTYVREIIRRDRRDPSASRSMTLSNARDLVFENYPWARENPSGGTSTDPYGATNVYSVSIAHTHGNLTAYIDGGTEKVFKEVQYKRLAGQPSLPPGPGVQNVTTNRFGGENLTLTVNRTYAGGPLRVQLTNETGEPLDGDVTIGGEYVIRTGADGVVWTLGPTEQFRVKATYEGRTVEVAVTPSDLETNSTED